MQALRGPGELARKLEKERRGQPQRFLNKNKKKSWIITYHYLHIL